MWYTTGKINVTKNSNIVIGVGTKWNNPLSGVSAGRMLILQSSNQVEIYEIASVQSDTRLTLAENYNGITAKDKTYKIPTSPSVSIEQFALEIASSLAYHQQQLDGWQKILTGSGDVELIAPDGQKVIIKSQKKLSNLIDGAVKKSGDEITGQLRFLPTSYGIKFFHENGNELVLRPSGDSFVYAYYDVESNRWANKLRYTNNNWFFENIDDVTINNKSVLKVGDYGIGSSTGAIANNFDAHLNGGFYQCRTTDFSDLQFASNSTATLLAYPSTTATWKVEQLSVVNSKEPRIYYRCDTKEGKQNWYEAITTANIKDFAYEFKGDLVNKSLNDLTGTETGIYFQGKNVQATTKNNYPINEAGTLQVLKNGADGAGCCQIYTAYRNARQFIRNFRGGTKTWEPWVEQITTANSTVDSNGFLKKASPILRLFANDNIEEAGGFKKSGCALVNDLASGVTATRIDVGHYEIHGSLGFAKEGWYITLPEDANGNKKFFAEYSVDENNIITVKTYTKKFDFENCQIVAGKPIDITEGRWIDIRLEMPVVEVIENEEPIPSTLNPVIVSEVSDDI